MDLGSNYINFQKEYNLSFYNEIKNKIKIAIYAFTIKNGGRARITSLSNFETI